MLARQRQQHILAEVQRLGGVRVSSLTSRFGVSDMTVRRDLEALARQGLVHKVHGGATLPREPSSSEPGFTAKSALQQTQKARIAAAAAALVPPDAAIAMSAGTTVWTMARQLLDVPGLTVGTNSVPVADLFHAEGTAGATVVLSGGVRSPSDALVGPVADATFRGLHFDVAFVGCHGLHMTCGLTTPNLAEAETNRALIRSARRLVVLADSTKWDIVGLSSFATVDEIDVLVTDDGLDVRALDALRDRIDEVIVT